MSDSLPIPRLSRRSLIGAASVLPFAASATARTRASSSARGPLDLANPKDFLTACIKMRGALDDKLVMGFCHGRWYGVVGDETTHLCDMMAANFLVFRPRPDGGFDDRYFEIAYFTDPVDGRPLETLVNPYTNKRVSVPQTRFGPNDRTVTPDARVVVKGLPQGAKHSDHFLPALTVGDNVWIAEQIDVALPASADTPAFRYSELTTAHALKSDLDNPRLTRVPTTTSITMNVSWRPWLEMGKRPGHMLFAAAGRMVSDINDLPPTYLRLGMQHHSDVMKDPYGFITNGW